MNWISNVSTHDSTRREIPSPVPLVIGFGDTHLAACGAGVRLVDYLRRAAALRFCEFIVSDSMSFIILSRVEAAASLLVIDAAEIDSPAGTIRLLEGKAMDCFLKRDRRLVLHERGLFNLFNLLNMARLRHTLPERRALLRIQPSMVPPNGPLSPAMAQALADAVDVAHGLLERWGRG